MEAVGPLAPGTRWAERTTRAVPFWRVQKNLLTPEFEDFRESNTYWLRFASGHRAAVFVGVDCAGLPRSAVFLAWIAGRPLTVITSRSFCRTTAPELAESSWKSGTTT